MILRLIDECILWLLIYSVAGWIYESIICSIEAKKFINRGFLNGPYCPIYGFGAVIDFWLLYRIENPILLFLFGAVINCTLEYIISYGMEKIFHARWWDYSDKKFNINGRVCLLGGIVFGLFSVLLIKFIHPFIYNITNLIPSVYLHNISAIIVAAAATDTAITVIGFSGFNDKLKEISTVIETFKKEANNKLQSLPKYEALKKDSANKLKTFTNAHKQLIKKLDKQQIRMITAFPKLKSKYHNVTLSEIKEAIKKYKEEKKKNKEK
ncbi:MAG: putative ABC transporter permease [Lachnospirales bacterium]